MHVPGYANSFSLASNVAIFSCNMHLFILNGFLTILDKETQVFWMNNLVRIIMSLVIMVISGVQLEDQVIVISIDRFQDREDGKKWANKVIGFTLLLAIIPAAFTPAFYANTGIYSLILSCILMP